MRLISDGVVLERRSGRRCRPGRAPGPRRPDHREPQPLDLRRHPGAGRAGSRTRTLRASPSSSSNVVTTWPPTSAPTDAAIIPLLRPTSRRPLPVDDQAVLGRVVLERRLEIDDARHAVEPVLQALRVLPEHADVLAAQLQRQRLAVVQRLGLGQRRDDAGNLAAAARARRARPAVWVARARSRGASA